MMDIIALPLILVLYMIHYELKLINKREDSRDAAIRRALSDSEK